MKQLNKVQLGGLRAVEAVGRLGNLKSAASELGVTAGAVSQQIQKIERQLNCSLFDRGTKGLTLTPLGSEVQRHLSSGMAELSTAIGLVQQDRSDALTVSVAPVFAGKWLVWRLSQFNAKYPNIRVRVDASQDLVDPNTSDVDVCIRVGRGDWNGVHAEKFLDQRIFPVCAPAMAAQLKTPSDLANVPVITEPNTMFSWNEWLKPNGFDMSVLGSGPVFSDASLCLDAAVAGQGVFLAWETLACDAMSAGCLLAPFPNRVSTGIGYWFVTANHVPPGKHAKAFMNWLRVELETSLAA